MKLNAEVIARASLELLNENGLDGLTMRAVAKELGVQAAALYWHVKNKQELLDEMAKIVLAESTTGLEGPRSGEAWTDWLAGVARGLRAAMLGYRDGARVVAGTNVSHPAVFRITELTLRTLQDAGLPLEEAARGFPVLLHFTIGFTIEEQARQGLDYDENPYRPDRLDTLVDATRYPLTAGAIGLMFDADTETGFEHGLGLILAGLVARVDAKPDAVL
ncbi:TetR/AcrR family transcriptional regulator C-terminal domain-containing protein [Amycolatopsis albispora]|uniref:TetR family transcriptional regulator n=1 Tax=Amycolatopsis albispora TaxID=1804986 RepID=A0A344LFY2_9PSEU|nr:TetR/AcrR family transcriptional regulator C-terminal domain-containing protein [Amycolatopsis albispora]AXB46956.1 TetR family transcriptional regulator [Amycolatopsis albispora]